MILKRKLKNGMGCHILCDLWRLFLGREEASSKGMGSNFLYDFINFYTWTGGYPVYDEIILTIFDGNEYIWKINERLQPPQ